ncbi:MAG: hypothetical protein KC502_19940 [Myxococcales bacterium]|nr:hypothetical protein [Myxococcales bacterium]
MPSQIRRGEPTHGRAHQRYRASVTALVVACCLSAATFASVSPALCADKTVRARGIELAKVARSRAKAKSFALAAQMFHEAYNIDRTEWSYLFSAGRCEQLAKQFDKAERSYARYLNVSPTDHKLRQRAIRELTNVRMALAKARANNRAPAVVGGAPPVAGDQPPASTGAGATGAGSTGTAAAKPATSPAKLTPNTAAKTGPASVPAPSRTQPSTTPKTSAMMTRTVQPAGGSWHRPVGWGGVAVGVIVAGVGGALYAMAAGDKSDLETQVADGTNEGGLIAGISFADAQSQKSAIESRLSTWGAVTAAGAGLVTVGAILLATAPDSGSPVAALSPDGRWQFGWRVQF